jgi:hypothetical protein
MVSHGVENKHLREIALTFAGKTLEEVARDNGMTPGSLRARFSTDGYDVKIRRGVIEEIALPYRDINPPEKKVVKPTVPVFKPKAKPKEIPYKKPTRIVLSGSEFEEVREGFRVRAKKRRQYRHFV